MARPAKAIAVGTAARTKEEKSIREEVEKQLRGRGGDPKAPGYLSNEQRDIFNEIVDMLKESGIICELDVYVLTVMAVALDRIQTIEESVNENSNLMYNTKLMGTKNKYMQDFFRCCNELCMSPQARAKIGSMTAAAAKQGNGDILESILDDDD